MANALARIGGCVVALTIFASVAFSQQFPEWRADDETTGQEYQHEVDAAIQDDGSWTGVWIDYRLGYPSLFARSFGSDDSAVGPAVALTEGFGLFGLNLNAYSVSDPSIVAFDEGTSVVVWQEERRDTDRIQAMLLSGTSILAGPITVNDTDRRDTRSEPRVSISGNRILVTWKEGSTFLGEVYGQVYENDLTPVFGNFLIHGESDGNQGQCRIAAADEGWVAAWWEISPGPIRVEEVLLRKLSLDGAPVDDPVRIEIEPEWDQTEPTIVPVPDGYFVCWTASRQGVVNLRARTVDLTLDPVTPAFLVVAEGATVTPREPEAIAADESSVLVVWTAGPGARSRFHARQIALPNDPLGNFLVVEDLEPPPGGILTPRDLSLRGSADTALRILWHDNRDGWDLCYQMRVGADGAPVASPVGLEVDDGSASQVLPTIALFNDGGAFATWADYRTGGMTIYGTLLGDRGQPTASAFRISETTGGSVSVPATNLLDLLDNRPSVATMTDGRAVAAWTTIVPGGNSKVYLQHFERTGDLLGNNITLPQMALNVGQSAPQITPLTNGQYLVVWRDTSLDSNGNIMAHLFTSDGTALGDTIRVYDPYQPSAQLEPDVASSGTGETVVVWLDNRRGNNDVYAQRLGPTGAKIHTNTLISAVEIVPVLQSNPAVAAAPDRYVVVWDDNPLGQGRVAGLLVTLPTLKNGKMTREEQIPFGVSNDKTGFMYPKVAMAPDGRFVVTYWDTSNDSTRVISQRYTSDARELGPSYSVLSIGGTTAAIPGDVAADSDSILYTWSDSRDMRGWDVRVRKVSWEYGGVVTAIATTAWSVTEDGGALELRWSVPLSHAGSLYRVWRSSSNGTTPGAEPGADAVLICSDPVGPLRPAGTDYLFRDDSADPGTISIYWIEDMQGEFAGPWTGRLTMQDGQLALRAINNPSIEATRLSWSAPVGVDISFSIFDAAGRRLRVIENVASNGGAGELIWDGRDDDGRDVPAGIFWVRMHAPRIGERTVRIVRLD